MGWTYSHDDTAPDKGQNPRVEPPNAVLYVTYTHPDGRTKTPDDNDAAHVRVPFDPDDLHQPQTFLAQRCAAFDATDQRVARITSSLPSRALTKGPQALTDLSARIAADEANNVLLQKLGAALTQKQITDLTAIDPTITDAVATQEAAAAALKG